jgi:predicted DNA-binding protein (MmcQ/YjbR family)
MNVEELRTFALSLPEVTEDLPFDEYTLALRLKGKIFGLIALEKTSSINLKCDPERAIELREQYPEITPGYHMNKLHWNTLACETLPRKLVEELILHSYELILKSLPKKIQAEVPAINR